MKMHSLGCRGILRVKWTLECLQLRRSTNNRAMTLRVRVDHFQNPEFKFLEGQNPEFKILEGQNPEFKILEGQNPEFKILEGQNPGRPKSSIQDFGLGACTWKIALKYKVKQSKNGKFTSKYKARPIDFPP